MNNDQSGVERIRSPKVELPESWLNDIHEKWHQVKVNRDVSSGKIEVFVDNMKTPLMTSVDHTLDAGFVGFGSFDNTASIRNITIYDDVPKWSLVDNFDLLKNGNINGQTDWIFL